MANVVIGLGVFTVLCLATKQFRLYGVIGIAIFAAIYPVAILALAVIGGAAYLAFRSRFQSTKRS